MTRLRSLLATVLLLCSLLPLTAQVYVGYCPDDISTRGLSNARTDATIGCATAFTRQGLLRPYQGCQIGAVSVGLSVTEGLSSLRVWVRASLDGPALAEAEADVSSLSVGWNDITLPTPVSPSGHDTLYCGYEYTQRQKGVAAISHGTRRDLPLSFYLSAGGKWSDVAAKNGPVSIRAIVTPATPQAIRLTTLGLEHRSQPLVPAADDVILLRGTVQNLGAEPLRQLHLSLTADDLLTDHAVVDCGSAGVGFGDSLAFCLALTPGVASQEAFDRELRVEVAPADGEADASCLDCLRTLYYDRYDAQLLTPLRPHLVEEFTSEGCGFAPLGQQRLRQALALSPWAQDGGCVILSHHEGFGPADPWRITSGSDYAASLFGPDGLTFAPAALVDRCGLPVSSTLPIDSLVHLLQPAPVSAVADLDVQASISPGHTLVADVSIAPRTLTFCADPQLVVCLVQAAAPSVSQRNYYPDLCPADVQPDVIRCYLHDPSGSDRLLPGADMEAILQGRARITDCVTTAPGQPFTRRFTAPLPDGLTPGSDLRIVAYICERGGSKRVFATAVTTLADGGR